MGERAICLTEIFEKTRGSRRAPELDPTGFRNIMSSAKISIKHIQADFPTSDLDNDVWADAALTLVDKYWSGLTAPGGRYFTAKMLWSETALYVHFEALQSEPLIVNSSPVLNSKTIDLWDRDVCEIFIAPDKTVRNKYFEFEIAPTGEWIDLGINITPKKRLTDLEYKSGMTSAVSIEKDKVVMAIKIPFKSLGRVPKVGDIWLGNIFRCVGKSPTRGYLSWQATNTRKPNFHVPSKFGEFEFVK